MSKFCERLRVQLVVSQRKLVVKFVISDADRAEATAARADESLRADWFRSEGLEATRGLIERTIKVSDSLTLMLLEHEEIDSLIDD